VIGLLLPAMVALSLQVYLLAWLSRLVMAVCGLSLLLVVIAWNLFELLIMA
jgi:hypothetical protein